VKYPLAGLVPDVYLNSEKNLYQMKFLSL